MTTWAMSLTLGPVQRFIAAGRRGRDLWWGSTWLSDLTWQLAEAVPSVATAAGARAKVLLPGGTRVRRIKQDQDVIPAFDFGFGGRVSNHLHLEVEGTSATVTALAEAIRAEARALLAARVGACVEAARRRLDGRGLELPDVVDTAALHDQLRALREGDFLEVFGAWVAADGATLHTALGAAGAHLQAVKLTRAFEAPSWSIPGRSKSHLDPGRDSVLRHDPPDRRERDPARRKAADDRYQRELRARRALGIGHAEALDLLGFARRVASFGKDAPHCEDLHCEDLPVLPFPPISRMALDPWLRGVQARHQDGAGSGPGLRPLRDALWDARKDASNFSSWCSLACDPEVPLQPGSGGAVDPAEHRRAHPLFPFDASILTDDGIATAEAELGRSVIAEGRGAPDSFGRVKAAVRQLHATCGVPDPYYAVIAMDGDGVGTALMEAKDLPTFHDLVARLDAYADGLFGASGVLRACRARAFYAGGDDLLAYLPADQLLRALVAIDALFSRHLPTLSVSAGVVVAHLKDDLREVRQAAHEALEKAKARRKEASAKEGFTCIVERPRSGVARSICGPTVPLAQSLAGWIRALHAGTLSLRTPETLDRLARLHDRKGPIGDDHGSFVLAKAAIYAKIRRDDCATDPALAARLARISAWSDVAALAEELRVAARLWAIWEQDPGDHPDEPRRDPRLLAPPSPGAP